MPERSCEYLIIGGGLAGVSAIEGLRSFDPDKSITLLSSEKHMPYDRPPLSKKLWFGKKKVEDIFLHDDSFYSDNGVNLLLGTQAVRLDAINKTILDNSGDTHRFNKLLLATGGAPRSLDFPGADLWGLCYYRYIDDYLRLRQEATAGSSALILGGGFIGSEMAAALRTVELHVTMLFPETHLGARVFPKPLSTALQRQFTDRGIQILTGDLPASVKKAGSRFITETKNGHSVSSDIILIGAGISPTVHLAQTAGLTIDNGIVVNEFLQTSHPDIYAAGDNARFPYQALGQNMRIEHWDNSLNQGKHAGRNMAGAAEPFTYMPYFFSDLFDFGYEAVGLVDSRIQTFADWQDENKTGVVYYLEDNRLRGAMMCNLWDKVDQARDLIRRNEPIAIDDLRGAIS